MRGLLAILLIVLGVAAARAIPVAQQVIIFGVQTSANSPPPPPLSNLRITNSGAFRVTGAGDNRAISP